MTRSGMRREARSQRTVLGEMPGAASQNVATRARDAALRKLDKEISEAHEEARAVLVDELLDRRLQIMASQREQEEVRAA